MLYLVNISDQQCIVGHKNSLTTVDDIFFIFRAQHVAGSVPREVGSNVLLLSLSLSLSLSFSLSLLLLLWLLLLKE